MLRTAQGHTLHKIDESQKWLYSLVEHCWEHFIYTVYNIYIYNKLYIYIYGYIHGKSGTLIRCIHCWCLRCLWKGQANTPLIWSIMASHVWLMSDGVNKQTSMLGTGNDPGWDLLEGGNHSNLSRFLQVKEWTFMEMNPKGRNKPRHVALQLDDFVSV